MAVVPIETNPERLWRDYVAAQTRAKETLAFDDGVAAGRAWSAFLAEYVPPDDLSRAVHPGARR